MTKTGRKEFIKSVCLTGGCLCGFGAIASVPESGKLVETSRQEPTDERRVMMQEWIAVMLKSVADSTNKATQRTILKRNALVHYNSLKMDQVLDPYIGDMAKFIIFLEKEWSWKIGYNPETGVLLADENKNYCVCPMINSENKDVSGVICYCSEGFAELMFSKVSGRPVKAEVISSVRRGDATCIYKVTGLPAAE